MGSLLRRYAWLAPIAFAAVLAMVGVASYRSLRATMQAQLGSQLQTILDANVTALRIWAADQKAAALAHASDPTLVALAGELREVARRAEDPRAALLDSPAQRALSGRLADLARTYGHPGFGLIDPGSLVLAGSGSFAVASRSRLVAEVLADAMEGRTRLTRPMRAAAGAAGEGAAPAVMLAAAPVRDAKGAVVAVFAFDLGAEDFTEILAVARAGESGETYAFDADGSFVSRSRFEDQLREIALLPSSPNASALLTLEVRDPGGDLTRGFAAEVPRKAQPLTRMAADAVAGGSGVDVQGYRDYRGVPVVGAWTWIPELEIGVTTEIDVAEAYAGLVALERRFAVITGLLVLASAGLFLYTFVLARLRTQVDEVRQLGRYRIERRLGRGGMGTVYLASHALLRRPTAVKVLRGESASRENVARFQREVQVSSSLTHPNTIEIYDFGNTPDGTFYYAMEYVNGVTLGACVEADGPQPEARVVHVLKQACASIAEAHAAGLIHRDLKPSNIMLCERGGLLDFVKVLDFGLVKHQAKDVALTDVTSLTGTPLYLPPEVVHSPDSLDVRADLYQLGAIGYYLVVGRHVFRGDTAFDVLAQHVGSAPEPPSVALGRPVSPDLETLILRCLEKDPGARHANAGELLAALESCRVEGSWGQPEAREWWELWWKNHPPSDEDASPSGDQPPTPPSHPSGWSVDVVERLRRPGITRPTR
jgi:hypothetical protein